MELLFRYQRIYLNQAKEHLTTRDDVVDLYMRTDKKELEKNIKLQGLLSNLQVKTEEVVTDYRDVFFEDKICRRIRKFSLKINTGNHSPI